MAGLYLHIPFCRRKCGYCNFFSLASLKHRELFTHALCAELRQRASESGQQEIHTLYWGGGTPSLLEPEQFTAIIQTIREHYALDTEAEITLEVNPDDLSEERLIAWKDGGVNRISIGIQSFHAHDLAYLERTHDPVQALGAVEKCRAAGFAHMSMDLIYGIPGQSDEDLQENVQRFLDSGIEHLSAYALTLEERTILWHKVKQSIRSAPDDILASRHFLILGEWLARAGYEQYEISNFALPGKYSRHNTSYWNGTPYLGFGPSAHSYDGQKRYWNVANLQQYIQKAPLGEATEGEEVLDTADRINEYLMTSLRTMWGCKRQGLEALGGHKLVAEVQEGMAPWVSMAWASEDEQGWRLSPEGMLHADGIAAALFVS
ncbi:MAG: radical SAM family heme chaperone HemW [Bacteroidales bacterium]|nr:radical SAM family heme chaperone HemW [Bacteroidales bacterium]